MNRFNLVGRSEILNMIEAKKGIKILENKTLRKQNIENDDIKEFKMKKHISEKMLSMYLQDIKNKEINKLSKLKKKYNRFKSYSKKTKLM